jgi:hypothetical protein
MAEHHRFAYLRTCFWKAAISPIRSSNGGPKYQEKLAQLVIQQFKPELSYSFWFHETSSIDKLMRLAERADTEHDKDDLLKEAAERKARLDELTKKEEARLYRVPDLKGKRDR